MPGPPLTASKHKSRAERHTTVGSALFEAGDEWAVVCFFYAAFHHVKTAMLEDPLFDDIRRMHEKHADLIQNDRLVTRHVGRRGMTTGKEWGVNELVGLLYPQIRREYEQLHQASIQVRYQSGLPGGGALEGARNALTVIEQQVQEGGLVAT